MQDTDWLFFITGGIIALNSPSGLQVVYLVFVLLCVEAATAPARRGLLRARDREDRLE